MTNWVKEHDMAELAEGLGGALTGYLEYNEKESEESVTQVCGRCGVEEPMLVPSKEKREWFRSEMKEAMRGSPASIAPAFNHFWYHGRCSGCGADICLMRS